MKTQLIKLVMLLVVGVNAGYAQSVHIPDPNLRAAISAHLNIPDGSDITQVHMDRLIEFHVDEQGVRDLRGMETAANLRVLSITANPISDLTPISTLPGLEFLGMWGLRGIDITPLATLTNLRGLDIAICEINDINPLSTLTMLEFLNARINQISDLTPLANLTNLVDLHLNDNRISDLAPLSGLTNLVNLWLNNNRIVDVTPLTGLSKLQVLEIDQNLIEDYSPLDSLTLSYFAYDQVCDIPSLSLEPRLANRTYPSIFARWSGLSWPPATNRPDLSGVENIALHDLRFSVRVFGLDFRETPQGFKMVGNLDRAIQWRDEVLALNPNAIHLVDVGLRAAPLDWFPPDSPYWILNENGTVYIEFEGAGHGLLDFTKPIVQDRIVAQAVAVAECGLYDGIFFDFWSEKWVVLAEFRTLEEELHARDTILRRIRAETRPDFLIMGNVNIQKLPRTAPYVNGGFMETVLPFTRDSQNRDYIATEVEDTLLWLEAHLREPRINGLEGWSIPSEEPDSPNNLRWMRAITALSLTHSDGYVLYTIPYNWHHYWYDFWDADLGRPVGKKGQLYENIDGLYIREFTNGWAVYNHSGDHRVITLPEETQGVASGLAGTEHALANLDGEMYLRVKPKNPADVNGDGIVNILDLTLVAQALGTAEVRGDVNGDGVVNVFDLVIVAEAF